MVSTTSSLLSMPNTELLSKGLDAINALPVSADKTDGTPVTTSGSTIIVKIESSILEKFKKINAARGVNAKPIQDELVLGLTNAIETETDKVQIKKVTTTKLIAAQFENLNLENSILSKKMFNIKVEGFPLCASSLQEYIHPDKQSSNIDLTKSLQGSTGNVLSTIFSERFDPNARTPSLFTHSEAPAISFNKDMADRKIELLDNGNLRIHTGRVNVTSPMELSDSLPVYTPATVEVNPHLVTRKIVIENGTPSLLTIENLITKTAEAAAEATLNKAKKPWFNFDFKLFSPDVKINGEEGKTTLGQNLIKFTKDVALMSAKGLAAICLTTGLLTAGLEAGHWLTDSIPGSAAVVQIIKDKVKDGPVEIGLSTEGVSVKMGSAPKESDKTEPVKLESPKVAETELILKTEFYQTMATWNSKDTYSINKLKYITMAVENIQSIHKISGQVVFIDELDLKEAHTRLDSLTTVAPKITIDPAKVTSEVPKNTPYNGLSY